MSTLIKSLLYNGSVFAPTTVGSAVTVKFGNPSAEGLTDNIMSLDDALSKISANRQSLVKVVASTSAIDVNAKDADSYIYLVPVAESEQGTNDVYAEYIVNNKTLEKIGTMELDSRVDTITISTDSNSIVLTAGDDQLGSITLGNGLAGGDGSIYVDSDFVEDIAEEQAEAKVGAITMAMSTDKTSIDLAETASGLSQSVKLVGADGGLTYNDGLKIDDDYVNDLIDDKVKAIDNASVSTDNTAIISVTPTESAREDGGKSIDYKVSFDATDLVSGDDYIDVTGSAEGVALTSKITLADTSLTCDYDMLTA